MSPTSDPRALIQQALNDAMEAHFTRRPSTMPVALPLGEMASAVERVLADGRPVPRVPEYDAELAKERHFTGVMQMGEDLPTSAQVWVADDRALVQVDVTTPDGATSPLRLPEQDAVEMALSLLGAAYALRAVDAPG